MSLSQGVVWFLAGACLLVMQAALAAIFTIYAVTPYVTLPLVIFLGTSHDVRVVPAAVISFLLGYLVDIFSGSPIGLHTFIFVATSFIVRGLGLRLFSRGIGFQMLLTFLVSIVALSATIALRTIFEPPIPLRAEKLWLSLGVLFGSSTSTALLSPFIFTLAHRLMRATARRVEEGAVLP